MIPINDVRWDTRVRIYDQLPQDSRYVIGITRFSLPLDLDTKIERFDWSTSEWVKVEGHELTSGVNHVAFDRGTLEALGDAITGLRR